MTRQNIRAVTYSLLLLSAATTAAVEEITFVFIGSRTGSAYAGVAQGVAEANVQGRFLGQRYALAAFSPGTYPASLPGETRAIVAAVTAGDFEVLSAAFPQFPVFNVSLRDDALRDLCIENLLHTLPSRRMYEDALSQWRRKEPRSAAVVQAWHPSFTRYAAGQLNKRYQQGQEREMDDPAWAAWAAVKMSSDMMARNAGATGGELLTALRTELEFDGQKGSMMSFRDNGQLRQPLLLIEKGHVVGEAPVRGVSADLDSLGTTNCPK